MEEFIQITTDPIYGTLIATALVKSIGLKIKSTISAEEKEIILKRQQELEELTSKFISTSYAVNQENTVKLLTEARIGGFSMIGKFSNVFFSRTIVKP